MKTATSHIVQANGLNALMYIRGMLNDMLAGISDEQMLHQPVAGSNHGLWIIGHLAVSDDQFRASLGGGAARAPESWEGLFSYGSRPRPAADYPPIARVKKALHDWREDLLDWIGRMDEAALEQELPEDWRAFAPTYAALIASIAAHEALHVGQLTVVRKSLGLNSVGG